jgi:hypothetical protein
VGDARFDHWAHERSLQQDGAVMIDRRQETLDQLRKEYNAAVANGLVMKARMINRRIKYIEGRMSSE